MVFDVEQFIKVLDEQNKALHTHNITLAIINTKLQGAYNEINALKDQVSKLKKASHTHLERIK